MKAMAKYKLPTGQFAMASWDVGDDWPDDVLKQMAEVSKPEWTLMSVIKFPDGINQEWVYKVEITECECDPCSDESCSCRKKCDYCVKQDEDR